MFRKLPSLAIVTLLLGLAVPHTFAADDLQVPSDVEGLVAYPGDSEVILQWNVATDNVGVTGYKIYYGLDSVSEDGGSYTLGKLEVDDDISYTVDGLENGVTYYFAVTALDATGNESEYYSNEASATPVSTDSEDTTAPYVLSVTATNNMVVEVVFSEDVDLPASTTSAFNIVSLETDEELDILDAYLSDEDARAVLVVTGTQEEGMSYMITVGTQITDLSGNAVVSGTTDTAVFDGGSEPVVEETTPVEDTEDHDTASEEADEVSPEISGVEVSSLTEVTVTFSEDVVLSEDSENLFVITLKADESELAVLSVTQDEGDPSVVVLEVEEMAAGEDYILVAEGVRDMSGNELTNTFDRTASYSAPITELSEILTIEDINNFVGVASDDNSVDLSWDANDNNVDIIADQLLYVSDDNGDSYGDFESLGSEVTSHTVSGLTAGQTYTFKLTVVDVDGNETEGSITTVTLPETGAGLGIVLLATALGTGYLRRKRV